MKGYLKKISELMKVKKLTRSEFAKKIDRSPHTITNWFKNRSKLDVDTMLIIAETFNVHPGIFFDDVKYSQVNEDIVLYGKKSSKQASAERFNHLNIELEKLSVENEFLKQQIKDKEEIINLLKNKE